ncbi:DUF4350 domain-containing protein [Microbacterium thalli]|uniref:DUF4350 domain-containing protein n=1 Tax=Microbacterium thalli TaxID=3027921 RepID=A0ABT5SHJ3_9MICO|nr:DUF4350 domain-containing protein [Microbacterium thalli]MDD7962181.1 DUF4350 domain-containing protein [Microbacterium thalli]
MTTVTARTGRIRSVLGWAGITAGVLAAGLGVAAISGIGTMPAQGLLDPEAAGPEGSRALVEVLRDRGVEVDVARDRTSALAALGDGDATLAIADTAPLDDDDLTELASASAGTILLEPRTRDLRLLLGGAQSAGFAEELVAPDCAFPDAAVSGSARPGEVFTADGLEIACYPAGEGFGLVGTGSGPDRVVALDATSVLVNRHLAEDGHAALGLNLLGGTGRVVWYLPALGDGSLTAAPSLGELTPPWVTPAILLLLGSVVAAGLWRGRRFGPLVAENLPVTVRASETTEGRARLYAAAAEPVHALDQLRRDTLRRLARLLGLGAADAAAIADAAAARLDTDRARVRGILLDDLPRTDRELVDAADRLRELETAVHRTVRPERNTP